MNVFHSHRSISAPPRGFPERPGKWTVTALAAFAALSGSASAANIAPTGRPVMGVNNAVDADNGIARFSAGTLTAMNDGDIFSRVDNWFGGGPAGNPFSFAGYTWLAPRHEQVNQLTLSLATFFDGGWFGTRAIGPGAGGALGAQHLIEPTVQISTDGGTNWTTVAHTSDYMAVMTGHLVGDPAVLNPTTATATFNLTTPATGITGIRLIGENGGPADGDGFLGVFELEVNGDVTDADGDGLPDAWESAYSITDAGADADGDGLTNLEEFTAGTLPNQADSDGDGLPDGPEVKTHLTNPQSTDSDGDGLTDGREVNQTLSNPLMADSDGDGLTDGNEVNTLQTNPNLADTDSDTFPDNQEVTEGSDPLNPNSVPTNVAIFGRGIMGTKLTLDGPPEEEMELFHAGLPEDLIDGSITGLDRVDTYNGGGLETTSYVGVMWDTGITNRIARVELTLATFFDGGWFGVNKIGPGAGGRLAAEHLAEPRLEISLDGLSWTAVEFTSDYVAAMTGHGIGGGANPNPTSKKSTFTLAQPTSGTIYGIRLIGTEGGQASGGFLGVYEFAAHYAVAGSNDTDNDGMTDSWERQNGLLVGTNDAAGNPDNDGLTNKQEFDADTNPQVADTDNDGLNDGAELNTHHTDPLIADTDGDTLTDGHEVTVSMTDPTKVDTDGDGYTDPAEINSGSDPKSASSRPTNIALVGTALIGISTAIEGGTDTPVANAGPAGAVNDGSVTTRVDTFGGDGSTPNSYVGIRWNTPVPSPVERLELDLATFFDGGWFGVGGVGPGSGGVLSAAEYLVAPTVQTSTDGGTNWTTVAHTSDYMTKLEGHALPAVDFGAPTRATAIFTLATPATGINAIRIIGSEGGTASGGFLGVFELAVHTGAAPQGFSITNVAVAGNQIRFEFSSQAGKTYRVEYLTALGTTWQLLSTVPGDGTVKQVTDSLDQAQRFYRVTAP